MILDVPPIDSTAFKAGIKGGEEVISLNGDYKFELIDFIYAILLDKVTLELKDGNSLNSQYKLSREGESQLGLSLKTYPLRTCRNKCIFCYIDQLPKGLRDSLYVKDDDFQLSFLTGSYISFSNFTLKDIKKIKRYSLSPLYISLHTTDPKLRNDMMGNQKLPDSLKMIKILAENKISMHFQVVLCPGINDGENLKSTIEELAEFYPYASSIAIVPVSSTRYRVNKDIIIKSIDGKYSKSLIKDIRAYQKRFQIKLGEFFVYLSDEFYLSAGLDFPREDEYFDYPQIENGVGLSRKFLVESDETLQKMKAAKRTPAYKSCSIVTGKLFEDSMKKIGETLENTFDIDIQVIGVENEYLGSSITVTGLLTGKDIIERINTLNINQPVLIPDVIFSDSCGLTLDNMTQDFVRSSIGFNIIYVSPSNAETFIGLLF